MPKVSRNVTDKIDFPWFLSKELPSRLAPLEGGNEEHNLDQTLSKMCLINQEIRCHFLLDGIKKMGSVSKEYTKVWSTRQGTHTTTRPNFPPVLGESVENILHWNCIIVKNCLISLHCCWWETVVTCLQPNVWSFLTCDREDWISIRFTKEAKSKDWRKRTIKNQPGMRRTVVKILWCVSIKGTSSHFKCI